MTYNANQPRDWHGRWTADGENFPPPPDKPYAATYLEWAAYFAAKERYDAMVAEADGQAPAVQLASDKGRLIEPGDRDYPKDPPPPPAAPQSQVNLPPVDLPGYPAPQPGTPEKPAPEPKSPLREEWERRPASAGPLRHRG